MGFRMHFGILVCWNGSPHCFLNVFEGTYILLSNEQKVQIYINGAEDAIGYGSVLE